MTVQTIVEKIQDSSSHKHIGSWGDLPPHLFLTVAQRTPIGLDSADWPPFETFAHHFLLNASKLSTAEKSGFLKGFQSSTGGRLGAMRAVRTLDARLYVEVRGIYGQLREQMGKWSVKNGELSFTDDAQAPIYNARIERINVIAERQEVAQRQALGIK